MKKLFLILMLFSGFAYAQIYNSTGTYTKTYQISKDTTGHPGLFIGNKADSSGLALQIYNGGQAGSKTYVPGWQSGSGWKLDYDTTTKEYTLTVDNMTIRGTLAVYEFLINQIRATNGNFLVTASCMVDSLSSFFPTYPYNWIYADSVSGNGLAPFQAGDMIMCQEADLSGATYDSLGNVVINKYLSKRFIYKVDSVNGLKIYVSTLTGAPTNTGKLKKGDVFVRFGNVNNSHSGMVGIYSDEQYSPYIRVTDSVNSWSKWKSPTSIKMQAGKLLGLTMPNGVPMSGYGLYANRFYLYADSNNYLTYDGNSFKSVVGGTNISQMNNVINLTASSVQGGWLYSAQDTGWVQLYPHSWTYLYPGIKKDLVDSTLALRSGINIASDSISIFSSKILTIGNQVTTDSALIAVNASSIALEVSRRLADSTNIHSSISVNAGSISLVSTRLNNDSSSTWSSINLMASGQININGTTTFASGYNPTTKVPSGGAASDVNANTTTINGNKLTTGTVTADYVVAGISITSPTIQTLPTGSTTQRIVIDSTNQIRFFDAINHELDLYAFSNQLFNTGRFNTNSLVVGNSGGFLVSNISQIITVNGINASGNTGYVLRSDGTSFTPAQLQFSDLGGTASATQRGISSLGVAGSAIGTIGAYSIYRRTVTIDGITVHILTTD